MRSAAGVFDVSHMGEIETTRARTPRRSCSACSPTTCAKIAEGGAQYSVLCREDGGVLDDLFTYRLGRRPLPHGHQRLQPRARPRVVPRTRRAASTSSCATASHDYAMLAVQGPRGARDRRRRSPTASCPARFKTATRTRRRRAGRARLRHGLHGRGRRRAALAPERRARGLGRASWPPAPTPAGPRRARHAAPRGLLPPLRQRPDGGARPDRGRPGLVLQGGHRLHRRRRRPRRARGRARREARRRSPSTGPGIAAPGQPGRRRRRGHLRHACRRAWASASAWPTCRPSAREPGTALEIDVRGKVRAAEVRTKPLYRKES